jgi:voltage-gated sodium channel
MTKFFQQIANSAYFKGLVIFTILLAGVEVGLETYDSITSQYRNYLDILNAFILFVFIIEIDVKILAEGKKPWRFFQDGWNVFDFLIVIICLLSFQTRFVLVIRLIRILRVLRLVTVFPQLRLIIGGLFKSVPSMIYIFLLLMLHFYIYAAIGTTMFGKNDPFHFGSLHISMLTMFRAVTLEDWADIMYVNMYGCDKISYEGSRLCTDPIGSPVFAAFYFVSFIVIGAMIVLNLLIGFIISGIEEMHEEEKHKELMHRKEKDSLSIHEEIYLIEKKLLAISDDIRAMNTRLEVMFKRENNKEMQAPQAIVQELIEPERDMSEIDRGLR